MASLRLPHGDNPRILIFSRCTALLTAQEETASSLPSPVQVQQPEQPARHPTSPAHHSPLRRYWRALATSLARETGASLPPRPIQTIVVYPDPSSSRAPPPSWRTGRGYGSHPLDHPLPNNGLNSRKRTNSCGDELHSSRERVDRRSTDPPCSSYGASRSDRIVIRLMGTRVCADTRRHLESRSTTSPIPSPPLELPNPCFAHNFDSSQSLTQPSEDLQSDSAICYVSPRTPRLLDVKWEHTSTTTVRKYMKKTAALLQATTTLSRTKQDVGTTSTD